jgi:hypothetical protein
MAIDEEKVQEIITEIGVRFRTFGGGVVRSSNNPLSHALKNQPLAFAAGESVENVVRFILAEVARE